MNYAYWKLFDNKNYSLNEAIDMVLNNPNQKDIQMRLRKPNDYKELKFDKDNLPKNLDDLELPMWAIKDPYWHLYVPDYEMESKVDEVRDYLDDVYEVDSRFWDIHKMDVGQVFNELDNHVLNDELRIKIILWLRDNNMIPNRY